MIGECTDCGHAHGDAMCDATIPTMRGGELDEYACNCTGPHPDEPADGPPALFQMNPDPPF